MQETILLAAADAVRIIKPILPDTREFLRGTLGLIGGLVSADGLRNSPAGNTYSC